MTSKTSNSLAEAMVRNSANSKRRKVSGPEMLRTLEYLIVVFTLMTASEISAQVGVFSGGTSVIGSTSVTGSGSKFTVVGNSTFLDANTSVTSAALIRGNHSYSGASTPDYTWWGNDQTGLFHPAGNTIGFSINGTEKMRLSSSGRLLMGTTTDNGMLTINNSDYPSASFSVSLSSDWAYPSSISYTNRSNSAHYQLSLSGTGTTFYVAGAGWIYSQGNYLGSDINIKDDIRTVDSASSKINKLRGITYKLKKEKQNLATYGKANEYMGVIAQDVEKVAPQAIKNFPDGTKGVCYEMLIGLLIEGMKEHNARMDQLQQDINSCCTSKTSNRMGTVAPGKSTGDTGPSIQEPTETVLKQNTPNPFNKETSIGYFIAEKNADASILIFDMNGKLLKTMKLRGEGSGTVTINGGDLNPGMYFYSLIINGKEIDTKKMILTE